VITIIDVDKFLKDEKAMGPIISSQYFMGKSYNPHPEGLFSEDIFGIDSSPEYKERVSWIELNTPVIQPAIYDILTKRLERKISLLLSGEKQFIFLDNGILEETIDGDISGMKSLYENRKKWKFRRNKDEEMDSDRNKIIDVFEENIKNETFFTTKLLVIPPAFRPISILEEKNEVVPDPINEIYRRIIILSHQLKSVSGSLFDVLAFRMQIHISELYDFVRKKISKKEGMIRSQMLGKRVDFSARAVITPNPNLELGRVGVPFRLVCELFEPFMIYGLVNSQYSKSIPPEFYDEIRKFLGKESAMGLDLDNL